MQDKTEQSTANIAKQPKNSLENSIRPKKGHKILFITLGIIAMLLVLPILVAGYFGVIPGLSTIFKANKPVDLGVRYTEADLTTYMQKTNTQILPFNQSPVRPAKPTDLVIFSEPTNKNVQMTSSEVTARLNNAKWSYMPLSNVQVKFSDNGVVELSGNVISLQLSNFAKTAGNGGYSDTDVTKAIKWVNRLANNPAIYIKAQGSVVNNVATIAVVSSRINRINLPTANAGSAISTATEYLISQVSGLSVSSNTFNNNTMTFIGSAPTKIYVK